ncbi:hypothetical protein THRCLA_20910 [Thraustotheca clavata]|uniref:Uncharacterized protein n=1 Tax=Thraustotheca clavata TaxID=74557 RepID=A0A1W0A256_9STRA|nr:hypothetical protein THRCLA_20910 [Thraustotheca clavata]
MASYLETLRSLNSDVEKELFSVLRRYGRPSDCTPENVRVPCTLYLQFRPSDPEFPFALENGLSIAVSVAESYPETPATFTVQCDVPGFDVRFADIIANNLNERMIACRGQLMLRKLLTWLDNNLKDMIMPPKATIPSHEDDLLKTELINSTETIINENLTKAQDEVKTSEDKVKDGENNNEFIQNTSADEENDTISNEDSGVKDICKFFLAGKCKRGEHCKYSHSTEQSAPKKKKRKKPVCKYFLKNECRKGSQCRFRHDDKPLDSNEVSEEQKNDDKDTKVKPTENTPSEVWSTEQQQQLDDALKKYPLGCMETKSRWEHIAQLVDGKSMSDCVKRFKYLTALVKACIPHAEPKSPVNQPLIVEDKHEDVDEETYNGTDKRIVPAHERVKLDLAADVNAWHIDLGHLFFYAMDTVQLHDFKGRFQCLNCPLTFTAALSVKEPNYRKWCPRCSVLHAIEFRPILLHAANSLAMNLTPSNCGLVDLVTPLRCLAICAKCSQEGYLELIPRIRAESVCRNCHARMALDCKAYNIVKPSGAPEIPIFTTEKKKKKIVTEALVVGQPLPNQGKCSHYAKSLRWFRFQCCGTAYPCDICHKQSSCPQADKDIFASRFICGLCSREHPTSLKECPCGNAVGTSAVKSHWEGGKGCRSQSTMAATDKHKFRGLAKTQSQKAKRVGVEAKIRRDKKLERQ